MALEDLIFALERGEHHPQERHERGEAKEDEQPVAQRVDSGHVRDFGHAPCPLVDRAPTEAPVEQRDSKYDDEHKPSHGSRVPEL